MKRTTLSLLILMWVGMLSAQTDSYTLYFGGTVKDPNGVPVPNATIFISIPATSVNSFTYAEKIRTGANGFCEHKVSVPNKMPQGIVNVILYNCDGKEVVQKGTFGIGAPNKFEFHFKWCKSIVQNKCTVTIVQSPSGELVAKVEGLAPVKYRWSSGQTTAGILPKEPGEYCVKIMTADSCETHACFKVTGIDRKCSVVISAIKDPASNAAWKLTANATGVAPFKYFWSHENLETQSIIVSKSGNYCVKVMDANGCLTSNCIVVGADLNCKVAIEAVKDPSGKVLKLVAVSPNPNLKYYWSNNSTTSSIEPAGPGKYCVTATDEKECKVQACYEVPGVPACKVVIQQSSTGHLVAKVEGQGPFKYKWSTGEETEGIIPKGPGEYCVEVYNEQKCAARACFKVVAPQSQCAVEIGVTQATGTEGWKLTAHAKGKAPFKYYWNGITEGEQSILVTKAGNYCVTVIDAAGCKSHFCRMVGMDNLCRVSIEPTKDPSGKIVKLSAVTSASSATFQWSTGETTPSIIPAKPGKYCVLVVIGNTCKAEACFEVPGTQRCNVVIKQSASGELIAHVEGTGTFKYSWSTGETTRAILPKTGGEYCVKVINEEGCIASACFKVIAGNTKCAAEISVTPSNTTTNAGWKLTVHAKGAAPFKYLWNIENATTESITVSRPGTYCVTVQDSSGCKTNVCRTVGVLDPACKVAIEVIRDPSSPTVILKAIVPSNDYKYKWSTGEDTPFIIPAVANNYCVTVTSSTGCTATACFRYEPKMSNLSYNIEGFVSLPVAITVNITLKGKATLYYLTALSANSLRVLEVPLQVKDGKPNFYSFGKVPAGKYLVKITLDPETTYGKEYLPTYYGDVIKWAAGSIIAVPHNGGQFNVMMVKGTNAEGPGNISGTVILGNGLTLSDDGFRGGNPVKDASILLVDSHDNPIRHVETSDKGVFQFKNLAFGTYKVLTEMVGMEPEWRWVTINELNPQSTNVSFSVPESSLTNTNDVAETISGFVVYPNPVSEKATLSFESAKAQQAILRIAAMTGQTVLSQNMQLFEGPQRVELNLANLPSGLYFVNLTSGQKVITAKLIKE